AISRQLQDGALRQRVEAVFESPIPTVAEIAVAERVLASWLESVNRVVSSEEPAERQVSQRAVLALIWSIFGIVISPVFSRGGILLRLLGMAVVDSGGVELSSGRALMRALIAWAPVCLYIPVAAQQAHIPIPWQVIGMVLLSAPV